MTPERLLEITRNTMEAAGFCFLVSQGSSGSANARLMQPFALTADWVVWCGASPSSRKVAEVRENERVTLGYAYAPEGAYVTLLGQAQIVTNPALRRRYWRESFAEFWPEGPEGENYVLIKFVPDRIELMNIAQGVAPEPFGLCPAVLERSDEGWQVVEA
ncbi:MAG: pyridoxamine 5'-phosphate oxidase family protein [Anaerolineales bacterium]